jgi:predicted nucleic acid-binding protein
MTGLDTNVIVGLMVSSSTLHEEVTRGLENLDDSLCTTPTNVGEVLRILTHPRVFKAPLTVKRAVRALSDFLEGHQVRVLDEDVEWWKGLSEIEKLIPGLRGNEVFDARIALCLRSHRVKRVYTLDSDMMKYPFLKAVRPL